MPTRFPNFLWLVPLLAMAGTLYLFPKWMVDDAYISYRYAANFLASGGWVWNEGGQPLEGFTGYLLPLLAAAMMYFGISVETGMHVVGAAATVGGLVVLAEVFRKLQMNQWISFIAICIYAACPFVYVHAFSGLETNIFTLLILLNVLALLNLNPRRVIAWKTGAWVISVHLLALTRPEGILFGILSCGWILYQGQGRRLKWLVAIAGVLIPVLAFQLWRWSYFGTLLPNSVLAKQHPGLFNPESAKAFIAFIAYYLIAPLGVGFILLVIEADHQDKQSTNKIASRKGLALALVLFVGISMLVYLRSHLFMNFSSRFFAPMAPLILTLAALMADNGWEGFFQRRMERPKRWALIKAMLIAAVLLQCIGMGVKWRSEIGWVNRYQAIMEQQYKPVGRFLKGQLQASDTIICYMDAGAIPFFSGLRTVDFGRLNDKALPTMTAGGPEVIDYFFKVNASAVVFTSFYKDRYVYLDEAHAIQKDPRFDQYKLDRVYEAIGIDDYYQFVYFRQPVP